MGEIHRAQANADTRLDTARKSRLDALQGLRGTAALLVVLGHALLDYSDVTGDVVNPTVAYASGALGVSAFFVISGFLMVYVHGGDFGTPGATRQFYGRRIARIVPLYWAVTLLYGAKEMYFHHATAWDVARSMLFIPYQSGDGLWRPVLGQGWTLNYEMAFYAIFGLALILGRGVWLVIAIFGGLALCHVCEVIPSNQILSFWSHPIVLYFLVGVLIGLIRARAGRGPSFRVAFWVAILLISLGLALIAWLGQNVASSHLTVIIAVTAVGSVVATAFARESQEPSIIRRLAKQMGDASYSIYLTHTFVIAPSAKIAVARIWPDMPMALFVGLMMALTAVVGYGVFRFVERPLIKLWTRIFLSQRNIKATAPAHT